MYWGECRYAMYSAHFQFMKEWVPQLWNYSAAGSERNEVKGVVVIQYWVDHLISTLGRVYIYNTKCEIQIFERNSYSIVALHCCEVWGGIRRKGWLV